MKKEVTDRLRSSPLHAHLPGDAGIEATLDDESLLASTTRAADHWEFELDKLSHRYLQDEISPTAYVNRRARLLGSPTVLYTIIYPVVQAVIDKIRYG